MPASSFTSENVLYSGITGREGRVADTPSDVETAATRGLLRPVSLALLALSLFAAGIFAAGRFAPAYVASASEAPPVKSVELVRLIEQVKSGLADAELAARANNQMTLFKLDSFDLEVNVVARAEGKSSIKLWTVGSDISTGSEKVQKVHLHCIHPATVIYSACV